MNKISIEILRDNDAEMRECYLLTIIYLSEIQQLNLNTNRMGLR